ncbi:hypothetical protein F5Y09DRAFT_329748 [Xylaria sp. FL1042]|nr:hypothetical protein F5Y09DRAFT_329748 [Xylaria sp. FL1042]
MSLDLRATIVILAIVFSVLPLVPVSMRFYARHKQRVSLGAGDYLIIPGVELGVYYAHDGQHVPLTPEGRPIFGDWYFTFEKLQYAQVLLSILAFAFIKASILMMYRRIFCGDKFRAATLILLVIVCCWAVSFFLAVFLACIPISKSFNSIYDGFAISNLIIDVAILTVPQPIVWKLNMSVSRKIAVSGVFLLGGFVVGISAARIYFYYAVATPEKILDTTYSTAPGAYWTHIDASVAVLFVSFSLGRIIRRFTSKISLRHHSKKKARNKLVCSLPQWNIDRASAKENSSST